MRKRIRTALPVLLAVRSNIPQGIIKKAIVKRVYICLCILLYKNSYYLSLLRAIVCLVSLTTMQFGLSRRTICLFLELISPKRL